MPSTIVPTYDGQKKGTWLRHGRGKYTYQYEGFSYDGEWEDGLKHGQGQMKLPDGSVYEGDFLHGEMLGRGRGNVPLSPVSDRASSRSVRSSVNGGTVPLSSVRCR